MGSLSAKCSACGTPLAVSHVGPCPKCGNNRKMYDKGLEEAFLRFRGNLSWRRLHEYYEQRPFLLAIVLVATVASPFIGFLTSEWEGVWFGLAVSVLTFILGARAITKVKDTERGDERASEPNVPKKEDGPNVKGAYRALLDAVLSQANRNAWGVKDVRGIAFFDPTRDTRVQSVPEFDAVVAGIGGLPLVAERFGTAQAARLTLQLVYEYFGHLDALRLDEGAIEKVWATFTSELEDSTWTTRGVANLRNFDSAVYPIELGDGVSLRGRHFEELESMGFSGGPLEGIKADWHGFGASSFVLVAENTVAKVPDNFLMLDSNSVWTKAQRALGSLRLVAGGDIGLGPMWVVQPSHFNVGLSGTVTIGAAIPGWSGSKYVWSTDIGSAYPSVYAELAMLERDGYGRSPGNLDLALRSFMGTYDRWPLFPDSKLLDSITALEAVLGSGSELAFRLSFRVACLLASGDAERSALLEAFKGFYDTRSAIVHGSRLGEKHQTRLQRVDELRSLVRRLLRSFVRFAAADDDGYTKAVFKEHLDAALVDNEQRDKLRRALGLAK